MGILAAPRSTRVEGGQFFLLTSLLFLSLCHWIWDETFPECIWRSESKWHEGWPLIDTESIPSREDLPPNCGSDQKATSSYLLLAGSASALVLQGSWPRGFSGWTSQFDFALCTDPILSIHRCSSFVYILHPNFLSICF